MTAPVSSFACGRLANVVGVVSVDFTGAPQRILHFYATDFSRPGVSGSIAAEDIEQTLVRQ